MTLKTSWFNFGIYKNAIRRFKWGSVLYFVILFLAVPFSFLIGNYNNAYYSDYFFEKGSTPQMVLYRDFLIVPMLTAFVVSVIMAVLLHRYMHESRQSAAVHSMPVTRKSNYVSNLLAGFTLMFAPVVTNGIILLIMSVAGYGKCFAPVTVLYWMLLNMTVLFVMFSISTFASFLTGQWATHIAITGLLHLAPIILALGIYFFSEVFIFGFVDSTANVPEMLVVNSPFVWIFGKGVNNPFTNGFFGTLNILVYVVMAIALYVVAYLVYRHRKIESCGDAAAFKIVRHILKYGITGIVMLMVSVISYAGRTSLLTTLILNLIIGMIAYFATEMVLSKSLKVFGKYKGFAVFCVVVALFVSFFAFTSVFGYETRVPDAEDVQEAAIYTYAQVTPYVADSEFIRNVTDIHKKFIAGKTVIDETFYSNNYCVAVNVSYKLKNGKELVRKYYATPSEFRKIMNTMYENDTYKWKMENLYYLNLEAVNGVNLSVDFGNCGYVYTYYFSYEDAVRLMNAYKADISNKSYDEIQENFSNVSYNLHLKIRDDDGKLIPGLISENGASAYEENNLPFEYNFSFNSSYENSMTILRETGHYDSLKKNMAENLYICKAPINIKVPETDERGTRSYKETVYTYRSEIKYVDLFEMDFSECVKIDGADGISCAGTLLNMQRPEYVSSGDYYAIYYIVYPEKNGVVESSRLVGLTATDVLPEYLKKYVE